MVDPVQWPDGKRFAFTVFDDTDGATLNNVGEVYALLRDLGLRTTKSIWPLPGDDPSRTSASTCSDAEYRNWVRNLQREGFEIGWHNATFHGSSREDTIRGLETFARFFDGYPITAANHKNN